MAVEPAAGGRADEVPAGDVGGVGDEAVGVPVDDGPVGAVGPVAVATDCAAEEVPSGDDGDAAEADGEAPAETGAADEDEPPVDPAAEEAAAAGDEVGAAVTEDDERMVGVPEVDDEQPAITSATVRTTPESTAEQRRPDISTTLSCQQYRRSGCRPQQLVDVLSLQLPGPARARCPGPVPCWSPAGTVGRCTGPA